MICVLASILLVAGSQLLAQPVNQPHKKLTVVEMAQKQTERQALRLNLSEKQAGELYKINLKYLTAMRSLKEQMRQIGTERSDAMKSMLSAEQFVQWSQMQQKRCARQKRHNKPTGKGTSGQN